MSKIQSLLFFTLFIAVGALIFAPTTHATGCWFCPSYCCPECPACDSCCPECPACDSCCPECPAPKNVGDECPREADFVEFTHFDCRGLKAEIVEPTPDFDNLTNTTKFTYRLTVLAGGTAPDSFSILIPRNLALDAEVTSSCDEDPGCTFATSCDGIGVPASNELEPFGKYLTGNCIGTFTLNPFPGVYDVSVTFPGNRAWTATDGFFAASEDSLNWAWGPIRGVSLGGVNPSAPQTDTVSSEAAGGDITVQQIFEEGELKEIVPPEGCVPVGPGFPPPPPDAECYYAVRETINGNPILAAEGPFTYGNNTTTCWPLSPPFCVCTALPCP